MLETQKLESAAIWKMVTPLLSNEVSHFLPYKCSAVGYEVEREHSILLYHQRLIVKSFLWAFIVQMEGYF